MTISPLAIFLLTASVSCASLGLAFASFALLLLAMAVEVLRNQGPRLP